MWTSTVLVVCFAAVVSSAPAKLPETFPKCKRADPKLNQCLEQAIQKVIPELVKGVPSVGLLPVDPLTITELVIDHGTGPVAIDLTFKNLQIKGFRHAKITDVRSEPDNYRLELDVDLPEPLVLDGNYDIKGKVLILPITGSGKCNLKLSNVKAKLIMTGEEVKKGGRTHMQVNDFSLKFDTSKLEINLANLFNGDKALGDNMNVFLNENWNEILGELKPSFEQALGMTFKQIASRFFNKVPYNEVFP